MGYGFPFIVKYRIGTSHFPFENKHVLSGIFLFGKKGAGYHMENSHITYRLDSMTAVI